jgi:hypothetical protein
MFSLVYHGGIVMNKVKATFYISEEIAELINLVAFQNKMKKSALVEQALKEYILASTAKDSQLKRFHELVDKRLDSVLSPGEQAELQALESAFDKADLSIMAQEPYQWDEPKAQALQIEQLNEIGKKLDDLLHQFVDNTQSQKEPSSPPELGMRNAECGMP